MTDRLRVEIMSTVSYSRYSGIIVEILVRDRANMVLRRWDVSEGDGLSCISDYLRRWSHDDRTHR